jgi:sporulation protein YlmC with PRC-barrel domain
MHPKEKVRVLGDFFFSQIHKLPIFDGAGHRVGELRDLAIKWEADTPKVTGLKYAKGTQKHIPIEQVETLNPGGVQLKGPLKEDDLIPVRDDEIYMGTWISRSSTSKGLRLSASTISRCCGSNGAKRNISFPWRWISASGV